MPKYFRIKPNRVIVDGESVRYPWPVSSVLLEEAPPAPVVDPILANNDWATIRAVCEAGNAADYWSLGDTKTDLGEDGVTRTFRICDMSGLYNKHVVFEQVELTESAIVWNQDSNVDDDDCQNNYNISDMRNTDLPALLANYSLDLQGVITNTTYKVAKNGKANPMVVLELTDKLFLPAEREILASRWGSAQEEWDALTRFALYALPENDNNAFRKKYRPSTPTNADQYWERSPSASNTTNLVCVVSNSGNANHGRTYTMNRIAPCFSF